MKTHLLSDDYYTPAALIHLERNKVPVGLGTVFSHLIRKTGLSDPKISTDEEQTVMARSISLVALYKHHHDPYGECRNEILNIVLEVSDVILS